MSDEDHLNPEDRKILNFMFANSNMSNKEFAEHFKVPIERIHDILRRDLAEVMRGAT